MREAISKASEFARPKIKGAYAFNFPAPTTNPQGEYAPSSFASPQNQRSSELPLITRWLILRPLSVENFQRVHMRNLLFYILSAATPGAHVCMTYVS